MAMLAGYDQKREDELLASIAWPADGYRLFEIATMDESSADGWLCPISESNALFMRRELWDELGGVDERFDLPGGGLLNLDTFTRASALPDSDLVLLLGEGTFHQIHGGVATNARPQTMERNWEIWNEQYEAIRGVRWDVPRLEKKPSYIGALPRAALARLVRAATDPRMWWESPLGVGFDKQLWSTGPTERPADPIVAALVDLAHGEFIAGRHATVAAVARLARERAPDEAEPQRLLSIVSAWSLSGVPPHHAAEHYVTLGEAYSLLDDTASATLNYQAALNHEPNCARARLGLAESTREVTQREA